MYQGHPLAKVLTNPRPPSSFHTCLSSCLCHCFPKLRAGGSSLISITIYLCIHSHHAWRWPCTKGPRTVHVTTVLVQGCPGTEGGPATTLRSCPSQVLAPDVIGLYNRRKRHVPPLPWCLLTPPIRSRLDNPTSLLCWSLPHFTCACIQVHTLMLAPRRNSRSRAFLLPYQPPAYLSCKDCRGTQYVDMDKRASTYISVPIVLRTC